jgi:RNA polymerase sigma factor (sigma-70 family)
MATPTTGELFERYRTEGDLDALGAAFDRCAPRLLAVARHLAPDDASAEDLVQATFLTALERARDFDAERALEPWLAGILANKARVLRRHAKLVGRAPLAEDPADPTAPDPATEAERAELAQAVADALPRVPGAYREVVRQHLFEGLRPAEIAVRLARPVARIRVQLHRGLRRLRRLLPASFLGVAGTAAPGGLERVRAAVLARARRLGDPRPVAAASAATHALAVAKLVLIVGGAAWLGSQAVRALRVERPPDSRLDAAPLAERAARAAPAPSQLVATIPPPSPRRVVHAPRNARSRSDGATIDVLVLDGDGSPLGGAELWSAQPCGGPAVGLGTSDARGRARLDALLPEASLWATAGALHCAPRPRVRDLPVDSSGHSRAEIRVATLGAGVSGRVLDSLGAPVAGARVTAVARGDDAHGQRSLLACEEVRTDADGGFRLDALPAGQVALVVVPDPALSPRVDVLQLAAGAEHRVEVALAEAAAVKGVVRDPDGRPVAGAWIRQMASLYFDGVAGLVTCSRADGSYRLEGLIPGAVALEVRGAIGGEARRSTVELEIAAGGRARCDLVLGERGQVHGGLRDANACPLAGWTVRVWPLAGNDVVHPRPATSDAAGSFRIPDVADRPHGLAASAPGSAGQPSLVLAVRPSEQAFALVVPPAADCPRPARERRAPQAFLARVDARQAIGLRALVRGETLPHALVRGRLADDAGLLVAAARLRLRCAAPDGTTDATSAEDGSFEIAGLPSGPYELAQVFQGRPPRHLAAFELAGGERRDLGELRLPSSGAVEVVLEREDGGLLEHPWVTLRIPSGAGPLLASEDGRAFRAADVPPGEYTLFPVAWNAATRLASLEIRPGETARLHMRLPAGSLRAFVFDAPAGEPTVDDLLVTVHDAAGNVLAEHAATSTSSGRPGFLFGFQVGSYAVEARSASGLTARVALEIDDVGGETRSIVVPLRPAR